jgi:predicted nucleic acid-binding protein
VLAWLLDEDASSQVRRLLANAAIVVASDLTLVECERVLIRAAALGELSEADAANRRAHLATAAARWNVMRIAGEVVDRARQPFPGEPIRTLDAIHLASALVVRSAVVGLQLLSLDQRVRATATKVGLPIQPE